MIQSGLLCLVLLFGQIEPEYEIMPGPVKAGVFRSNIQGSSYLYAELPTAATAILSGVTIAYTRGDIISVNDATFAYVYDGTEWLPLRHSYYFNEYSSYQPPKYVEEWLRGDNVSFIYNLEFPAIPNSLEVTAITDGPIAHDIEWVRGFHWDPLTNGYTITGVSPYYKWMPRLSFRFTYIRAE